MIPKMKDLSIIAWMIENGMQNEKGEIINFTQHKFLYDIYRDWSPNQVCLKAAQVGMSTLEIFKMIFTAKTYGIDIIYTMPTDADVNVFVGGKVNRIIANNVTLQNLIKDKDTVEQKTIGKAMTYFRGTFTKRAAISISADVLIHDEEDFSDQEIIGDYDSRLQHSKYKWNWHFGHPSTNNVGVDKYWQKSDQKHWFVKCEKCNVENYLSWPESVDFEKQIYICRDCKSELSDDARRNGRWVQKFLNKDFSGYWISLLMAPWIDAKYLIEKSVSHTEEYFTNRILGLPYVGGNNKVYEDDILGNLTGGINNQRNPVVIGLDTGIEMHYVVGNDLGLFYYGKTKEYAEIERMLKRWDKSILVADQGGDLIGIRELREKYPSRVFLCHYRQDRKTMELVQWGKDKESGNVVVDRNRMLQLLIDEFKQKRIAIFGSKTDWWDFWLHWNNIYRVAEEDALGVERYKWLRSWDDHLAHATLYWRVGLSKFMYGKGQLFGEQYEIKTIPIVTPDQKQIFNPLKDKTINLDFDL